MMNILYYTLETGSLMSQWHYPHFINELFHYGIDIDIFNPLLFENNEIAHDEVISVIKSSKYDLFFTDYCNQAAILKSTVDEVKRLGVPTLSVRFDNLVIPYEDKSLSPAFDLVWLTAKETKHLYDKWGVNTFFAPYAANPFIFEYKKTKIIPRVCFIGNPYGSRSIMINNLTDSGIYADVFCKKTGSISNEFAVNSLKRKEPQNSKYKIYLDRLKFAQGRKVMMGAILNKVVGQTTITENEYMTALPAVKPCEQSLIYSKYALALASTSTNHTDILKHPLKIINLRNFEIPMSGGVEICKYNPELAEYFEDNKEIIFYNDQQELIDKARYYTKSATEKEIQLIKEAARIRAASDHTWMNRFSIAFDILGLKYSRTLKR